jgi:hypothetical protein
MSSLLTTLSGLFFVVAHIPYVAAILRKQARPTKATWIICALLDACFIAAMISKGVLNGEMIGAATGSWLIMLLSFWYGVPGWKRNDLVCLILAIIGLLLWISSGDATISIIISSLVIAIGSIPTFFSAWKNPEHEDRLAWLFFFLGAIFQLCALPSWTVVNATQPVSFAITETVMIVLLWIRPMLSKPIQTEI